MKTNIHPSRHQVLAQCVCSNQFYFYSALDSKVVHLEVCNKCHPFYTKKQQVVSATGRVESFNSRFTSYRDNKRQAAVSNAANNVGSVKNTKVKKTTKPAGVSVEPKATTVSSGVKASKTVKSAKIMKNNKSSAKNKDQN